MRHGILLGSLTDIGCVRENNEDSYGYHEPVADGDFAAKGWLLVVADGMGGHSGGEVASQMAVDTIREAYAASRQPDPAAALLEAFKAANQAVYDASRQNPRLRGMGTTCTALVLKGDRAYFAHVGDTRLYLIRDGAIRQLTDDHSYVMRLVRDGLITKAQAETHPHKNILERALGTKDTIDVDGSKDPIPVRKHDVFVLCSDGLTNLVSDEEIKELALASLPPSACQALVALAKSRGGYDNVTIQIVKIE
jgi:protein phosphatase